uniref:Uncharacterized protein n=1 Tax=Monopterus albus TaxID=43700 RepID=A0A3Q3Q2C4_MONAL
MDFFYEDRTSPSTSVSTPNNEQDDSYMTEDIDHNLLRGNSSSLSTAEIQEEHTSSSIDDISRRAQELLEKINNSRTSNQKLMDSFQEKLVAKVTEMCLQVKDHMYEVYEENSNEMRVKLQELSEVLESCTKLSNELLEANRALVSLREADH